MNPVQIGRQRFSNIFWGIVDERVDDYPYEVIEKIVEDQQKLRADADYNTGSVQYDDAVELYKLAKFFQPKVIPASGNVPRLIASMNGRSALLSGLMTSDN